MNYILHNTVYNDTANLPLTTPSCSVAIDAVEHDVPVHEHNLKGDDDSVPNEGEKMIRDDPHSPSNSTTTFWNSLGTIASSVQSTVS